MFPEKLNKQPAPTPAPTSTATPSEPIPTHTSVSVTQSAPVEQTKVTRQDSKIPVGVVTPVTGS